MSNDTPDKSAGVKSARRRIKSVAALLVATVCLVALGAGAASAARPNNLRWATTADTEALEPDGSSARNPFVEVAALVQPSVVYETITWSGYVYGQFVNDYLRTTPFKATMQCTGFVVNPDGYIATAGHCVDPLEGKEAIRRVAATWLLEQLDLTNEYAVEDLLPDLRVDILGRDDQVHYNQAEREVSVSWGASVSGVDVQKQKPARVLDFQSFDSGDGALLKVEESDLNAVELAETSGVEINSSVLAIGYPGVIENYTDPDLTPTFEPGTVSSIRTLRNGLLKVFQLSAQLSGGMSGGPTVDETGRVVGVNHGRFVGEPFNYAVPAEQIGEFLAGAGVDNTVSVTTQTYRNGIRAYFDGDRATAVAALETVLEAQPANGLAESFLKKAKDLPIPAAETPDGHDATPWVPLSAAALAVSGILALGIAWVRRVRRRDVPPWRPEPPTHAPVRSSDSVMATSSIAQNLGSIGAPGAASGPSHRSETDVLEHTPAQYSSTCGNQRLGSDPFCGKCGSAGLGAA